ncbi:cadherin-related family member 5-like [Synchiropus splendidus]|uniref:cadherin-related family member 5-like n=1 Tax=Synchiropus splendidus TaxID=270530 RepID=UPI00237DF008|nr:cadherin-related family member 5-like [Synchiropus splendidus]
METTVCSSAEDVVRIPENNEVGIILLTITTLDGVTITFESAPENNPFIIEGNQLKANQVLDYEQQDTYTLMLKCSQAATAETLELPVYVFVSNLNDNPPVFEQNPYRITVPEASPIGKSVGRCEATDLDKPLRLYYTLTSETEYFKLEGPNQPNILINKIIDYDKVKTDQLVLRAQDTLPSEEGTMTSTTTILITISDVDNRPPWFQPCDKLDLGGAIICQNDGYTGMLTMGEKVAGVLPLLPGPLYAIDGDSGINGDITYSIVRGDASGLFQMDETTGNITLQRSVDIVGPISLTVAAAEVENSHQVSTTTVTFHVKVNTDHPPRFEKEQYSAVVEEVGAMAMDATNADKPLKIVAKDDDYAAAGGINPNIIYRVIDSEDFSINDGFLYMNNPRADGTLALQVRAEDTESKEADTAQLTVQVKTGLTTTTVAPAPTSGGSITTIKPGPTPEGGVTTNKPGPTSEGGVSTNKPGPTPEGGVTTNKPAPTPEGGVTTNKPGPTPEGGPTTNKPAPTPEGGVTTNKPGPTPDSGVSTNKPGPTPEGGITTNKPAPTPEGGVTTNKPAPTPEGGITTNKPAPTPEGGVTTNKPGPTPDSGVSTNKPAPTPEGGVTTNKPGPTPDGGATTNKPAPTPEGGVSTNKPDPTPEGGATTNKPGPTPEGGVTTNNPGPTDDAVTKPNDGTSAVPTKPDTEKGPTYGPGDMAAVGVTLGVLLLIALVVIGVLACRMQKGKADWRKIYEAIVFKGALTTGSGNKKGAQFTNRAFQSDEEKASDGGTITRRTRYSEEPQKPVVDIPQNENIAMASLPLHDLLDGTSSQSGTESAEKEVKPILTKERRVDDGYKAVWFKTDIDPSANEEVVIIPDSRENENQEETSLDGREEEEDQQSPRSSRVGFADSDHDSGLGVRMEDPSDYRDDNMLIDSL